MQFIKLKVGDIYGRDREEKRDGERKNNKKEKPENNMDSSVCSAGICVRCDAYLFACQFPD